MLTKTDVKREMDLAGAGPVVMIKEAAALLKLSRFRIYAMIAEGKLTKAGTGCVSRESIESLLMAEPKYFAAMYGVIHPVTKLEA